MLRLLALLAAVLGILSQGCTSSCDGVSDTPIAFLGGITNASRTEYQTMTWDGEYLSFPANRRYDLVHGLYTTPTHYDTYLGFKPFPLEGGGDVAESAGNMVVLEAINEQVVSVRNDTCQHFYLRLTAGVALDSPVSGGEGGAPGGDGAAGSAGAP